MSGETRNCSQAHCLKWADAGRRARTSALCAAGLTAGLTYDDTMDKREFRSLWAIALAKLETNSRISDDSWQNSRTLKHEVTVKPHRDLLDPPELLPWK